MAQLFSLDDALAFLKSKPRPVMLATVRADGRPHVAPVWVDVDDDGSILFNTGVETVKGRNLARTGKAALSVQDEVAPYAFATFDGTVTLSEDLAEVKAWAARIGGRYLGADRAEEMGERNGVPGELLVRLHVDHHAGVADLT